MWERTDPDGHVVVLTFEDWRHILERHGDMEGRLETVLDAITDPEERLAWRRPNEEWFYGPSTRPRDWVKVVVHYEGDRGHIVTAFARRWIP